MNRSEMEYLATYLGQLASKIGLRDWAFTVIDEPLQDGARGAEVTVIYGQREAEFRFRSDWQEWPSDLLRQVCTHELIHCHTNQVLFAVNTVQPLLGSILHESLHNTVLLAVENATDAIARSWAEYLPLPTKPKAQTANSKRKEAA